MINKLIFILAAILLCTGCAGSVYIQRSVNHLKQGDPITRIACLDPGFYYANGVSNSAFIQASREHKERFIQHLETAAGSNEIKLDIIDTETITERDLEYFNTLAPLRQHMILMNFLQRPVGQVNVKQRKFHEPNSDYVEQLPVIDAEFAHISESLGTPFVGAQMIIIDNRRGKKPRKGHATFLNIVVNVETGETVFREIREIQGFPGNTRLASILYDSFRSLNNNPNYNTETDE
ncbi:MAG: hypothetical protein AB8F95_06315 [Bacteroidia bacterium]